MRRDRVVGTRMGVLNDLAELLREAGPADRPTGERSSGAYWCSDCAERIRDVDVEGDPPPSCPSCGDEMRFEGSPDSGGCAC